MPTEVVIPMLGVTVEKGQIVEWLKNEGDFVERGESIFVVEADKVTTEVESPADGILAKILVESGIEVPVLTVVALIAEHGERIPADYIATTAGVQQLPTAVVGAHKADTTRTSTVAGTAARPPAPVAIMPSARKLAIEKGIDFAIVNPSGPGGVIMLRDIETAVVATSTRVSTLAKRLADKERFDLTGVEGSGVRGRIMRSDVHNAMVEAKRPALGKVIPMEKMRQVIARRMSESAFTAPHIYFFTDVLMDPLLDFRRQVISEFEEKYGLRPSVNDFLIKAVALNISDFPMLNASIKNQEIQIAPEINVCLAVALEDGLIVPAIANADIAGLVEIVRQREDLVKRARSANLTMEELERGTFTISSLAQYDITHFTAILNPPQSGILSVGKTREELYMSKDGVVKTRKVAKFGLSVDHRIIDGAMAAEFLQNLKRKLEQPAFTFLHH